MAVTRPNLPLLADGPNGLTSRNTRPAVRTTLGLLPVLAISAAVGGPAYAQNADGDSNLLDTITVEGSQDSPETSLRVEEGASDKLTAPLLDTPRTVTVITQRQIQERGASSLYDVLRTTPGVTLGTGEGGNPMGDRPFIRGYEASTDMLVDGVRSLGRTSYEAFNLESIEMIKGPGGAYSGRGATGGSLNMVSKQARLGEEFHDFTITAGTDSQYRAAYDGNFALGGTAAARLNLFAQDAQVPGRGGLRDDKLGVAASVVADVGDASRLTFNLYRSEAKSTPDFGIPMANDAYVTDTGNTDYGTGTIDDPYLPIGNVNHKQFFGSHLRDFRDVLNQSATLKFEHEFDSNMRLESSLAFIGTEQTYVVTRPTYVTGGLQRASRQGHRKNETLAFDVNLSGETMLGGMEHRYVLGFDMSNEKLRSASVSNVPSVPDSADFINPNPYDPITGGPITVGPLGEPTVTKSASLYFFDTVEFNPQWQANFGLRYEMFDVEQGARSRQDNMLNYQLGVVYKPAPNGSIYASFGTSANPSGQCAAQAGGSEGAGACTLTAGNESLEPETSRSYEIGTKWDLFDEQLSLTAALFRTEKNNARATDPITGDVGLVGKNRAQGLEFGVAGQINDRWAISGGYTYTDAKIIDDGDGGNDGNQMHYIARHSLALWTTYDVTEQWTVGGGATYTGKRFMNAANTAALPAQWRVDAMAAYEISDNARLQLNVNNLFDAKLYDASHVGLFANVQAGRNATLSLNYRF